MEKDTLKTLNESIFVKESMKEPVIIKNSTDEVIFLDGIIGSEFIFIISDDENLENELNSFSEVSLVRSFSKKSEFYYKVYPKINSIIGTKVFIEKLKKYFNKNFKYDVYCESRNIYNFITKSQSPIQELRYFVEGEALVSNQIRKFLTD